MSLPRVAAPIALVVLLSPVPRAGHATPVDVAGNWEGSVSVDEICPPPQGNDSEASQIRLELRQSDSAFDGKVIADVGDPDEFALTLSGSVDASGNFSASVSGTNSEGGSRATASAVA